MCAPSAPAPPDPVATAAAQTKSNIQTADANASLNRVDQNTPYGSSTYTVGTNPDGSPKYTQNVTLSPAQQGLLNSTQQGEQTLANTAINSLGTVQNAYSTPFSYGGPQIQSQVNGGQSQADAIKQAQDAAYNSQTQYLDPQFAQTEDHTRTQLANQGLQQGDKAYDDAILNFNNQKQQAYQSAQNSAVQSGDAEQNTLYGQGLSSANLNNSASAQSLNQQLGLYNQPLNTYNALMTGAQVQNPNFSSVPTATQANTDVAGITNSAYQNQLAQYQQQQSGINNLFSLGGSLGGAAILASDRRVKRDIRRIGTTRGGFPAYQFRYIKDGPAGRVNIGVMADEIAPHIPEAVTYDGDGFAMVNYAMVP